MVNNIIILGLVLNMIASFLIAYGRIFRSKKTIQKESRTDKDYNPEEERQRLKETRVAQIGVCCYDCRICHSNHWQYFLSIDLLVLFIKDYDKYITNSCKC